MERLLCACLLLSGSLPAAGQAPDAWHAGTVAEAPSLRLPLDPPRSVAWAPDPARSLQLRFRLVPEEASLPDFVSLPPFHASLASTTSRRLAELEVEVRWGELLGTLRESRLLVGARELAAAWLMMDRWWPAEPLVADPAGAGLSAAQGAETLAGVAEPVFPASRLRAHFDAGLAHLHTGGVPRLVGEEEPGLVGTTADGWFATAAWDLSGRCHALVQFSSYDTNRLIEGRETEAWTLGLAYTLPRRSTVLSLHYVVAEEGDAAAGGDRLHAGMALRF